MRVFVTTHGTFQYVAHSVHVFPSWFTGAGVMAAMQPGVSFGRGVVWCGTHQVGVTKDYGTREPVHSHARVCVASSEVAGMEMGVHGATMQK